MRRIFLMTLLLCWMGRAFLAAASFLPPMPPAHADSIEAGDTLLAGDSLLKVALEDVEIVGKTVKRIGNKDIYLVTKELRRGANNTAQMLGNIPGMYLNRMDNTLQYMGMSNIKILVDSLEKDEDFIKQLGNQRFDRIDVIHRPSGKYSGYDLLINLHQKENYEGYEAVVSTGHIYLPNYHERNYSVGQGMGLGTYTFNKWTFSIYENFYWRRNEGFHYYESEYLGNKLTENGIPNTDGSSNRRHYVRTNNLTLNADYQFNKQNAISITYNFGKTNNFTRNPMTIETGNTGSALNTIGLDQSYKDKGTQHTIGVFHIYRGDVWTVWTAFNYTNNEWNTKNRSLRTSGYDITDSRRNKLNYTWINIDVGRSFFEGKLSTNLTYQNNWRQLDVINSQNKEDMAKSVERRNTLSLSLSYYLSSNTSFSIGGNLQHVDNTSGEIKDKYVLGRADIGFMHSFNSRYWLRLFYVASGNLPSSSQTIDYGQFTDSLTWSGGNPNLKGYMSHWVLCTLGLNNAMTLMGALSLSPKAFSSITEERTGLRPDGVEGTYIATQPQNTYNRNWFVQMNMWKSIKDFRIDMRLQWQDVYASYQQLSNHSKGLSGNLRLSYNYNRYNFYTELGYNLENEYSAAPQSHGRSTIDSFVLTLQKRWLKGRLSANLYYTLPLHFTSGNCRTWQNSPAYYRFDHFNVQNLYNNRLYLHIEYRISGGKSVRRYNRTLYEEK